MVFSNWLTVTTQSLAPLSIVSGAARSMRSFQSQSSGLSIELGFETASNAGAVLKHLLSLQETPCASLAVLHIPRLVIAAQKRKVSQWGDSI